MSICSVEGCTRGVVVRGTCKTCYNRINYSIDQSTRLAWKSLIKRCTDEKNSSYSNYGGRGIRVCERWLLSFDNFLQDMGRKPGKDYSIDRIDVNGDYEPDNCKWSDRTTQMLNRRLMKRNTSGNTGVYRIGKKWYAKLFMYGEMVHCSMHDDYDEAVSARKMAENIYVTPLLVKN